MRVLFFHYGSEDWFGVGYLSSLLKSRGHQTDLMLYPHVDLYLNLPFLNEGLIEKKLLKKAKNFKPDLIAFSSTTIAYRYVKKIATKLKKIWNVPQIIGGIHATALAEHILSTTDIDIACRGEGEYALLDLVTRMEQGKDYFDIKNLYIKRDGDIIKNPLRPLIEDLDNLPFADKDIFKQYGVLTSDYNIITSRGCPYDCSYCCNRFYKGLYRHKGKYLRRRSVDHVIDELRINRARYGFKSVYFWDDAFCIHMKWLKEFSLKYKQEIGLPFHCLSRPENIDEISIALLKEAGCSHINMGIESGNESIREKVLKRHMPNKRIIDAARLIKEKGIKLNTFNMFAIPGEGIKEMWDTVKLNERIAPDGIFAFLLNPFPATKMADYAKESGMMTDRHIENMKEGILDGLQSESGQNNLEHPYKDLAISMKTFLPIICKSPDWLKPFFKKKVRGDGRKKAGKMIHLISLLFADTARIKYKAGEFLKVIWFYVLHS